jgi:hypothetical protein
VIGEVIEHLLFLRGKVEKYAKIGTGTNAYLVGGSSALLKLPWTMK